MELIDTHCHIDFDAFAKDRDLVLQKARAVGVNKIIVPAVTKDRWDSLIYLCQNNKGLYPALGLHPYFIEQHKKEDLEILTSLLEKTHVVAVGETGLDFFNKQLDKQRQIFYFEAQVNIAQQFQLPLIIHSRKSVDAIIGILQKSGFSQGGLMHAFNGSLQQAASLMKLGFKFGFGGMLTFSRSTKIRQLAQSLPLESIVLETDAPDMAVSSHHGERNSPEYLPEVLSALAEITGKTVAEIASQTSKNASQILKL